MKKTITNNNTAVVFGLFETGLGVIRSLGRSGIYVIGVDYKKDIAWYSRFNHPELCPNPNDNNEAFINWAIQRFGLTEFKIPVFITGDDFLKTFSDNREELSKVFSFNIAPKDLIKKISDKHHQFLLAKKAKIDVPQTWVIQNKTDIEKIEKNKWPLFIKGREVNKWRAVFGGSIKGFVANNYEELEKRIFNIIQKDITVIVQEIIQGPDTNHFKYCAYIDGDGNTKAEVCLQKIRQQPVHFGVGSVVVTIKNNSLLEAGRKFFKNINYRGVGSAEFKFDEVEKKFKLIELNARYWQQNAIGEAAGVNFPMINYNDLKGEKTKPELNYKPGIKWVNRYSDFNSFWQYRKEGLITYKLWRKSLKGKKIYSDFSWDDPIPGFYEFRPRKLMRIPIYIYKKIKNE